MAALVGSALLALILSVVLSGNGQSLPAGSSSSAASAALDPRLLSLGGSRPVVVIVQFGGGVSGVVARGDVARVGGRVVGELPLISGLAARMRVSQARSLALVAGVHAVSLNSVVGASGGPGGRLVGGLAAVGGGAVGSVLDSFDQTLGVSSLWRAGGSGEGVGVAVVDTGIDGDLPAFRGAGGRSRVIASAVANPNATSAGDSFGHGTDVAGIIAGASDPSDPEAGRFAGVAPGADLISVKVADEQGRATVLDVIYGLQFVVEHQRQYNIRVVNLSLDESTPQSYLTDPLDAAVEQAWFHGIAVIAAAGNRGASPDAVQYAPANDPYAITVGALDENGSSNPADDTIAPWSSRGATQDGYQKPEVYAPGAHIVSLLAPASAFADACEQHGCVIDGDYLQTSGTSMATPMISGLAADLLALHPRWSPDQLKGALTSPRASANPNLQEPNAPLLQALHHTRSADQGLTPNTLIGPGGNIDQTKAGWTFGSWSATTGPLAANYTFGSWSCQNCTASSNPTNPSFGSWSFGSWSTLPTGQ